MKVIPVNGDLGGEERFFQIRDKSGESLHSSSKPVSNLHKIWVSGKSPAGPGTAWANPWAKNERFTKVPLFSKLVNETEISKPLERTRHHI